MLVEGLVETQKRFVWLAEGMICLPSAEGRRDAVVTAQAQQPHDAPPAAATPRMSRWRCWKRRQRQSAGERGAREMPPEGPPSPLMNMNEHVGTRRPPKPATAPPTVTRGFHCVVSQQTSPPASPARR